ncbi:hypothetical protein GCM10023165_34870 [Variovorax defluvii]|uniref:Tandem-95 repeat protein n=1 Tax=Variovorax defluvii TaxID=913761 RepID=A0ABP8I0C0_9BURK
MPLDLNGSAAGTDHTTSYIDDAASIGIVAPGVVVGSGSSSSNTDKVTRIRISGNWASGDTLQIGSLPAGLVLSGDGIPRGARSWTGLARGDVFIERSSAFTTITDLMWQTALQGVQFSNNTPLSGADGVTAPTRTIVVATMSTSSVIASASTTIHIDNPPAAVADTGTAVEAGGASNAAAGSRATGNVLVNDIDPDAGDALVVSAVSFGTTSGMVGSALAGACGSLLLNADGSYTYTVNNDNPAVQALRTAGDTLVETFNYTVKDAAGATRTSTLTLTVQGANDAPVAASLGRWFDGTAAAVVNPQQTLGAYSDFTLEFKVSPTQAIALKPQSNTGTSGYSGQQYAVWAQSLWGSADDAGIGVSVGTNGISVYQGSTTRLSALLTWTGTVNPETQIAVVFANKTPTLYIDGVAVQTGLQSTVARLHPSTVLGGDSGSYFSGSVSDYHVWDAALSAAQVNANLGKGLTGTEAGLLHAQLSTAVSENAGAGTVVGTVHGIDVDSGERLTYIQFKQGLFSLQSFGCMDVDDSDTIQGVRIDSLPAHGQLGLGGSIVTPGQVIAIADLANLVFKPAPDFNGTTTFTYSMKDAAGAFSPTPGTFTLNVTPVNDTPVIDQVVSQDVREGGLTRLLGLKFSDVDAGDSIVTVKLHVDDGILQAAGTSHVQVTGDGTDTLVLRGRLADIDAFVAGGSGGDTDGVRYAAPTYAKAEVNATLERLDDLADPTVRIVLRATQGTFLAEERPGFIVSGVGTGELTIVGRASAMDDYLAHEVVHSQAARSNLLEVRINDNGNVGEDPGFTGEANNEMAYSFTSLVVVPEGHDLRAPYTAGPPDSGPGLSAATIAGMAPGVPLVLGTMLGSGSTSGIQVRGIQARGGSVGGFFTMLWNKMFGPSPTAEPGYELLDVLTDAQREARDRQKLRDANYEKPDWKNEVDNSLDTLVPAGRQGLSPLARDHVVKTLAALAGVGGLGSLIALPLIFLPKPAAADTHVNAAPTITLLGGDLSVYQDRPTPIQWLQFGDPDAGGRPVQVKLWLAQGTLQAAAEVGDGVTVVARGGLNPDGVEVSEVNLNGTLADINAFIQAGKLRYTTALHATGLVELHVAIGDNGGTGVDPAAKGQQGTGGPDDEQASRVVMVTIVPTNHAPDSADATVDVKAHDPHVFTTAEFPFSDPVDGDNQLAGIRITALPGSGQLSLDGTPLVLADGAASIFVSARDIAEGKLVFTPAGTGTAQDSTGFSFQVQDDGGVAHGGQDTSAAHTMRLDVQHAPVLSWSGADFDERDPSKAALAKSVRITDVDTVPAGIGTVMLTAAEPHAGDSWAVDVAGFADAWAHLGLGGSAPTVHIAAAGANTYALSFTSASHPVAVPAAVAEALIAALVFRTDNQFIIHDPQVLIRGGPGIDLYFLMQALQPVFDSQGNLVAGYIIDNSEANLVSFRDAKPSDPDGGGYVIHSELDLTHVRLYPAIAFEGSQYNDRFTRYGVPVGSDAELTYRGGGGADFFDLRGGNNVLQVGADAVVHFDLTSTPAGATPSELFANRFTAANTNDVDLSNASGGGWFEVWGHSAAVDILRFGGFGSGLSFTRQLSPATVDGHEVPASAYLVTDLSDSTQVRGFFSRDVDQLHGTQAADRIDVDAASNLQQFAGHGGADEVTIDKVGFTLIEDAGHAVITLKSGAQNALVTAASGNTVHIETVDGAAADDVVTVRMKGTAGQLPVIVEAGEATSDVQAFADSGGSDFTASRGDSTIVITATADHVTVNDIDNALRLGDLNIAFLDAGDDLFDPSQLYSFDADNNKVEGFQSELLRDGVTIKYDTTWHTASGNEVEITIYSTGADLSVGAYNPAGSGLTPLDQLIAHPQPLPIPA